MKYDKLLINEKILWDYQNKTSLSIHESYIFSINNEEIKSNQFLHHTGLQYSDSILYVEYKLLTVEDVMITLS